MNKTILIVDDEESVLRTLEIQLSLEGYTVVTATSGQEALNILTKQFIPVILSDQRMPNMKGSEFLEKAKDMHPNSIRILLSGYTDFQAASNAINHGGIFKFICKPWEENEFLAHIKSAFELHAFNENNNQSSKLLNNTLEGIMVTDKEGIIESVNTSFNLITEYHDIIGQKINLFETDKSNGITIDDIFNSIKVDGIWQGQLHIKKKSTKVVPVYASIAAIKDQNKVTQKYVYSFIDLI